jgi:hypothetical protein
MALPAVVGVIAFASPGAQAAKPSSSGYCAKAARAMKPHLHTLGSAGGVKLLGYPHEDQRGQEVLYELCSDKKKAVVDTPITDNGYRFAAFDAVTGKCAVMLSTMKGSQPILGSADLTQIFRKNANAMAYQHPLGPGGAATPVKLALGTGCIAAEALSVPNADGTTSREIDITPVDPAPAANLVRVSCSPQTTDADLRHLKVSGTTVSWTEAGQTVTHALGG